MLSNTIFQNFRHTVAERNLGVYGIHIYQEGNGSVEHRFRSDDEVLLYSASKTFTAVAVGMCQDEGRLSLEDKALDFFPECKAAAAEYSEDITVRNLLNMACGKEYDLLDVKDEQEAFDTDWAELFFRAKPHRKPGEHFFYANACTYMLARIVEKVSGENLKAYLMPRLFIPAGILFPQWDICPKGHALGFTGLHLTTSQLACIGRLMLQDGVYGEKQLVSGAYVRKMREDIIATERWSTDPESDAGYGYQIWRCTQAGAWRADGMYGQFSIVLPEKRAVVTTTCHNENGANNVIRAIFADIMPLL